MGTIYNPNDALVAIGSSGYEVDEEPVFSLGDKVVRKLAGGYKRIWYPWDIPVMGFYQGGTYVNCEHNNETMWRAALPLSQSSATTIYTYPLSILDVSKLSVLLIVSRIPAGGSGWSTSQVTLSILGSAFADDFLSNAYKINAAAVDHDNTGTRSAGNTYHIFTTTEDLSNTSSGVRRSFPPVFWSLGVYLPANDVAVTAYVYGR